MKSPLRYPGGKSRAVKHILPLFPEDVGRVCSPFFGGGSVELALASKGVEVFGYDKMKQLVWFWQALCEDNNRLADEVEKLREEYQTRDGKTVTGCAKDSFARYREDLRIDTYMFSYERAAKYYIINRSSFSGATFSGGWSERASYARFTESSVQRLRDFKAENFRVDYADFGQAIASHPRAFLYLDPPYYLPDGRDNLYGDGGDLHKTFDHLKLVNILKERNNSILSYNNCQAILKLYEDYDIIYPDWKYGMSSDKDSNEVLIINKG
ncbi:MAG: DNA adenine methylase [candidate division WOR-3 bacterium]|nr:MAG: DNA adenine methylase [candidate division WOR-3 bacterium]